MASLLAFSKNWFAALVGVAEDEDGVVDVVAASVASVGGTYPSETQMVAVMPTVSVT